MSQTRLRISTIWDARTFSATDDEILKRSKCVSGLGITGDNPVTYVKVVLRKMNGTVSMEPVMKKVLGILKSELSREEYLLYFEAMTPKIGDATKELRDKGKSLDLKTIVREAKRFEART